MTRQEFEALARKLEKSAARGMSSYRNRVFLLAMGGYLYIFFVLAAIVALFLLLFGWVRISGAMFKLVLPLLALGLTALRALWVRWPDPEGIRLSPSQAPRLFAEVEAIRKKLDAPKVHNIYLDDRFNAAMEQRPKLGVFGWPQGTMYVGLPLMLALSSDEFRAVLAHEMGHLSGNHGRMTGWIYRIRITWMQLLRILEAEGRWGAVVFTRFFSWYAPFLNAYSFVLARAQEYEADQHAAEVAGRETTARALMAVDVRGRFLDDGFWKKVWKSASESPVPPANLYVQQTAALREPFHEGDVRRWIRQSLAVKTGYVDTHPSLADRVRALGVEIPEADWVSRINAVTPPSAAEEMLGPGLDGWFQRFQQQWSSVVGPGWEERYKEAGELRERLSNLKSKSATAPLNEEEQWEAARLSGDLEGDEAALPLYEQLIRSNTAHVSANFEIGRILLLRGDAAGMDYLERAMQTDVDCTYSACVLAEQYMREHGRHEDAEHYYSRAMEFLDVNDEAQKEREEITANDTFMAHGLDSFELKDTRDHLKRYQRLKAAFLVRKSVRYFPKRPAYVLGIIPAYAWYQFSSTGEEVNLLNQIAQETPLPPGTCVMLLNQNRQLRKKIQSVKGAQIFGM